MTMCSSIQLSDKIQIFIAVVTTIGIFIALCTSINTTKAFTKQLKLNFFADYTKRYQEIILNFPENVNEDNFNYSELDVSIKDKTLRYMRAYFDLCSEEFHLYKHSHIDEDDWSIWQGGIKYALTKTAFIEAWKTIKLTTKFDNDFTLWVERQIPKH